jgi:hypothetical protein
MTHPAQSHASGPGRARWFGGIVVLAWLTATLPVVAHEMTVRGSVAAIEPTRIQIKTGDEPSGQLPAWFPIDRATKIKRGTKTVTLQNANIKINERVVAIIDHPDKGPMKTKEIRLAGQ